MAIEIVDPLNRVIFQSKMLVYQWVIDYDHPPRTGKLVPWFHGSVGFTPTSRGSKWATKRGRPPAMPPKSCLGTPQTERWVILIFLNSVDLTSSDCWKLLWHFAGISVWIFLLISLKELFVGHSMTWSNSIASHSTTDLADFLQLGLSENGIALKSSGSSSFSRLIIAHAKPKSKNKELCIYIYIYIGKRFFWTSLHFFWTWPTILLEMATLLLDLRTLLLDLILPSCSTWPFPKPYPFWIDSSVSVQPRLHRNFWDSRALELRLHATGQEVPCIVLSSQLEPTWTLILVRSLLHARGIASLGALNSNLCDGNDSYPGCRAWTVGG